jgi:hypothetical protein
MQVDKFSSMKEQQLKETIDFFKVKRSYKT